MQPKLKAAFDDLEHGWVRLTISYSVETFIIVASYNPSDSALELTNALPVYCPTVKQKLPGTASRLNTICGFPEAARMLALKFTNIQITVVVSSAVKRLSHFLVHTKKFVYHFGEHCEICKDAFRRKN
jgi:hypothetical protein